MNPQSQNSGQSFGHWAAHGAAVLFAATIVSGCQLPRFGNQVIMPPQANPISNLPNDSVSGYYQSAIQTQELCSDNSPTGGEVCRTVTATTVPTNSVPQIPFQVMTNPLAFVMTDMASGSAYLVGLGYSSNPPNLGLFIDSANTLFYVGNTQAETAFFDTACTVQWTLEIRGRLDLASQTQMVGNYPISGRVEAAFNVTQVFDGNCAATMQAMQTCYLNKNNCGGANDSDNTSRYNTVVAAFGDFIQAGTMAATDIPYVSKTGYHFSFQ